MVSAQSLRVPAGLESLGILSGALESFLEEQGQGPGFAMGMLLCLDEIATNIIRHGYNGEPGEIEMGMKVEDGLFELRLRDWATPFDPTQAPEPDLTLPLEERPIGGLGIHLVRKTMDSVVYAAPPGGGNELTMTRRLG